MYWVWQWCVCHVESRITWHTTILRVSLEFDTHMGKCEVHGFHLKNTVHIWLNNQMLFICDFDVCVMIMVILVTCFLSGLWPFSCRPSWGFMYQSVSSRRRWYASKTSGEGQWFYILTKQWFPMNGLFKWPLPAHLVKRWAGRSDGTARNGMHLGGK